MVPCGRRSPLQAGWSEPDGADRKASSSFAPQSLTPFCSAKTRAPAEKPEGEATIGVAPGHLSGSTPRRARTTSTPTGVAVFLHWSSKSK